MKNLYINWYLNSRKLEDDLAEFIFYRRTSIKIAYKYVTHSASKYNSISNKFLLIQWYILRVNIQRVNTAVY